MSSDDPTHNLPNSDQENNTTQPTITAVFRLLRDLQDGQKSLNSRFDTLEARFDRLEARFDRLEARFDTLESSHNSRFEALESRLARDFAAIDARFDEVSDEMKAGLLRLSDKLCDRIDRHRLHAESDYEDLLRRLRKLESKAS